MDVQGKRAWMVSAPSLGQWRCARMFFVFAWTLLAGCAMATYDAQTDAQLTSLRQLIDRQLLTWELAETVEPGSSRYDPRFYAWALSDMDALRLRMNVITPEGMPSMQVPLDTLSQSLRELRTLHERKGSLSAATFHVERASLTSVLDTLATYEITLKASSASLPPASSRRRDAAAMASPGSKEFP